MFHILNWNVYNPQLNKVKDSSNNKITIISQFTKLIVKMSFVDRLLRDLKLAQLENHNQLAPDCHQSSSMLFLQPHKKG